MGQKVNPVGFRLGFNRGWSSHWFSAKDYSKCLQQDDMIKKVIRGKYQRASISSIEIFRNRGDIVVNIHTAKPGIIIGRSGAGAQELRGMLEKQLFKDVTVKERPNFRLNILEVKNPELSATIVGENIANQIERRISVKRAMRQAIERTMEKKAKGIKIKISGRLGGAEIARSESASSGSIPLQTLRSDISYALAEAKTTFGVIGVKVWIYQGESSTLPMDQPTSQPPRFK